jgi:hypothetical protein
MEHDSEQQYEPTQRIEPRESVWQRDETTWNTMPADDQWSEQPTAPLPVMRPQEQRAPAERPGTRWQRTRGASRQRLLGLGCGGLLLVWFLAILIAAALSAGGFPGLPGIDEPFGPFVQAGPGATATPTQHPAAPLSSASPRLQPGQTRLRPPRRRQSQLPRRHHDPPQQRRQQLHQIHRRHLARRQRPRPSQRRVRVQRRAPRLLLRRQRRDTTEAEHRPIE